ncbi:acyl carrier protein [Candidatus Peribacteria bacterium]|jgi:acyl carrier protein|nr:acyl carrier protein [Candidatus Peribacteria bacterium]MBT4021335.1 acyl carrier protein [Candidatus Peribacteria bacterium]MBT4241204.1 acyl carrier protein [Candidatus Peribacteria bacterium]MBT4474229.1 acyl carrier protein [Candidatus Peribacteria bacterium]
MERQEILDRVTDVLVDALGVDEDEVIPEATLIEKLGAESIDFLDIRFRLEKVFHIRIGEHELFPSENLLESSVDTKLEHEGIVTRSGIAKIRESMPHANVDKFAENPEIENIQHMFTVQMLVNFVDNKLNPEST